MFMIYGIGRGADAIAGEEERKTPCKHIILGRRPYLEARPVMLESAPYDRD
jgi:hypothetical protein